MTRRNLIATVNIAEIAAFVAIIVASRRNNESFGLLPMLIVCLFMGEFFLTREELPRIKVWLGGKCLVIGIIAGVLIVTSSINYSSDQLLAAKQAVAEETGHPADRILVMRSGWAYYYSLLDHEVSTTYPSIFTNTSQFSWVRTENPDVVVHIKNAMSSVENESADLAIWEGLMMVFAAIAIIGSATVDDGEARQRRTRARRRRRAEPAATAEYSTSYPNLEETEDYNEYLKRQLRLKKSGC